MEKVIFEDEDFDWNAAFGGEDLSNDSNDVPVPCKKRKVDKRKFPGPAGLLPPINVVEELKYKFARITDKRDQKKESDHQEPEDLEMLLSREELIETNEAWKEIVDQEDLIASRTKYNTEFIKKEVKDGMALKVPVFCCVIRTIDITAGLDMSCEFMDDKGEICGVFHREIADMYGPQLRPGTSLVLKELPIIGPLGLKNNPPFVTVNANNIVSIYWMDDFGLQSNKVFTFSKELLQNIHAQVEKDNKKTLAAAAGSYSTMGASSSTSVISSIGGPPPMRPSVGQRPRFQPSYQNRQPSQYPSQRFPGPSNRPPNPQQRYPGPRPPVPQQRYPVQQQRPAMTQPSPSATVTSASSSIVDSSVADVLDDLDEDSIFGDF